MKRTIRFEITTEYDNMTVEQVLHKKLDMSSALITDLKKYSDGILFNSEHIRTIDRVSTGGVLEVNIYETVSENIIPNDIEIDVVYEDEDILIVNKPPCMPTHPSAGHYTGTLVRKNMPEKYATLMSSQEAAQLKEYMTGVVNYGTGMALSGENYTVAGKTGTAEYSSDKSKSHSWFMGFSNIENPELVVSVVVESADQTGMSAVTVAKQVLNAYYY